MGKNENATQSAASVATTTKEKVNAENQKPAEQKKTIDVLKKELEERLQVLRYKQQLADNREKFLTTDEKLKAFITRLKRESDENVFESQNARIVFQGTNDGYRNEDIFSISNIELILFFIQCLRKEIEKKVNEIETEIVF